MDADEMNNDNDGPLDDMVCEYRADRRRVTARSGALADDTITGTR